MRILHLEPGCYTTPARSIIEAVGTVDYLDCADAAEARTALTSKAYEAVFVRIGLDIDAATITSASSLRWIVTPTTGLDHIDLAAAAAHHVEVISLKGQVHLLDTVAATAELTWALLLTVVRHLPAAHRSVLAGDWKRVPFVGTELRGRTLGIIGYGRLGRMVATYGVAFGMRVLVYDHSDAALAMAPDGVISVALDELLGAADMVTLHLPLEPPTVTFLDAARIDTMKPGAVLVNTARGELLDEPAVIGAVRDGRLGGLGVDVVADDATWPGRVPVGQALIELARTNDHIVVTPHMGGYGRDAIDTTRRFIAQQFADRVHQRGPDGAIL